jgi:hypothetical protein
LAEAKEVTGVTTITVLLAGGPNDLPDFDRVRQVDDLQAKIKLCYGGGYEHFAYSGQRRLVDGEDVPVFQWVSRTRIAE